jgi:S-adenosylmethionine synthetase
MKNSKEILTNNNKYVSDLISLGYPDKLCDFISDSILDSYLEKDSRSLVKIDILIKTNTV